MPRGLAERGVPSGDSAEIKVAAGAVAAAAAHCD